MRNNGIIVVAGDPRPESLCFRRPRAMVANRAETLGGDEASRFRTIPLNLVMEEGECMPKERGRDRILFGVGVGDECVDHEIAVGIQVSPGSIVSDLWRGSARTHARKLARRTLDGGRRGQALLAGFGGEGEQQSDHGHLFIYRHASLFQYKEPLMSSPIFSAAG